MLLLHGQILHKIVKILHTIVKIFHANIFRPIKRQKNAIICSLHANIACQYCSSDHTLKASVRTVPEISGQKESEPFPSFALFDVEDGRDWFEPQSLMMMMMILEHVDYAGWVELRDVELVECMSDAVDVVMIVVVVALAQVVVVFDDVHYVAVDVGHVVVVVVVVDHVDDDVLEEESQPGYK